jgi:hypothetical protein
VLGQEIIDSGTNVGMPDVHRLSVLPVDENNLGTPTGLDISNMSPQGLAEIIKPKYIQDISTLGASPFLLPALPIYYAVGQGDVSIVGIGGTPLIQGVDWVEVATTNQLSSNIIRIINTGGNTSLEIMVNEYVYFTRLTVNDAWLPAATNTESINSYIDDQLAFGSSVPYVGLWKRRIGRAGLNFVWMHHTPMHHLIDPSPSNIIDSFIITKGYYLALKTWLEDPLAPPPSLPTPLDLRTAYAYLLNNKMISDTIVLHPGTIKLLFGVKADPTLQSTFVVIRTAQSTLTDNQIKAAIVTTIRNFFDITLWEFGETFFATSLFAAIHTSLPADISSVVLVPTMTQNRFGNLFQVVAGENEVFYPDITVDNIQLVSGYTTTNLNI